MAQALGQEVGEVVPVMATNRLPDDGLKGGLLMEGIDAVTRGAGLLSAVTLLFMTLIVVYEVVMRSAFNQPTVWVAEISVYAFVALVFLGLAVGQRESAHIQVEVLIDSVSAPTRRTLELIGAWLGLIFASITGWEMYCFAVSEYVNGTRDWGLLATPQWIPQTPVVIGYLLFCAALLREICMKSAPEAAWRRMALPAVLLAIMLALALMGRTDIQVAGTRMDWATLTIMGGAVLGAFLWNGLRVGLCVLVIIAVLGGLFYLSLSMSLLATGLILVAALMFLLAIGVPVGVTLGMIGLFGLLFMIRTPQLPMLSDRSWTSINSFTLTAVPTFVLMGSLLVQSGVTVKLFDMLVIWFGRTRAGLGHATVGASAVFAAVSGSSLATAATLGRVAAPEMTARGYSNRLTYGLVAAGATLGILIPPSIAMIIYGNTVGAPITVLFVAGIVPGVLLAALFALIVVVWSYVSPSSVPVGDRYPMSEKLGSLVAVLPFLLLIMAVLGSLYFGIATPTEAGAVGAIAALVLCIQQGRMTLPLLYKVLYDTVAVTSFIMLIVVGASIFGWVFDFLRLPRELVGVVTGWDLQPWMVVAMIAVFYLILGMFIESISMMLMTLSVTFPIIVALGLDPIWFGIVLVILVEIGLVTPPVGIVLFILRGMSGVPLRDITIGVLPFVALMLAFIALLYVFPEIVLWLPRQMS
ncbi:TRAP transporter large permease subunit [Aureimonas populi]|uniref:TRAP transporter large permease subunit n=1 Tax=Aureimonas populi TaxID=1701758 RepID=A0ABW5CR97_9HYPH|nr:TRAP transporter large permease subunit [Aureimonas populi]